jgi:hypothetical protein
MTLVGKYDRRRGGHAPGHLREAFAAWVDADQPETVMVGDDETVMPARWLLGILWNCTDTMPSNLCSQLDMRSGSSYAMAVRRLLPSAKVAHA